MDLCPSDSSSPTHNREWDGTRAVLGVSCGEQDPASGPTLEAMACVGERPPSITRKESEVVPIYRVIHASEVSIIKEENVP